MPARLLIAEDSRTQREVLRANLEQAGYEVVAAPDGEQALDRLRQDPFDMLVSDVVMPGMDGYELCRRAKEHNRRLPVVLLTSMTDPLDVVNGLQAGADNFLRKPYEFSQLRSRIEMMLHNKQLRDSGQTQMGLELYFLNRRFMITAERQQILDLLVSTFEDLVTSNLQLRQQEADLAAARDAVAQQLGEAQAQRDRLQAVLASVPQALVVVAADGTVTNASAALAAFVGTADVSALRGRRAGEFLALRHHDDVPFRDDERPLARALREGVDVHSGRAFDVLAERADGKHVPVLLHASPVRDEAGRISGAVGVLQEIEALSLHDPLTHLPGHTSFALSVDAAAAARTSELVAVVVLLMDRRSELSDSLGKQRTDELVSSCADRLRGALELPVVRQHTTHREAGYFGDSAFAVVVSGLGDEGKAVVVADALRRHMSGVYPVDGLAPTVTMTAGLATTAQVDLAASAGSAAQRLVPAAASAAQLGSRSGGGRVESSSPGAVEAAADQLRQETDLRRGLEQGELRVHYQPIVSLEDGVSGVEALVRWEHPERGFQSPADFIPLAEKTGLVVALGWEVLRQSCAQMALWRTDLPGADGLTVSVNLSPQQLVRGDLVDHVGRALADSGLAPSALTLEVTEGGVVQDGTAAAAQLRALKAMGVRVAIDDFGTGYSSLLQLRTLPVDTLKVDRQFVDGMMRNADDAVIVSASISLALALRLRVVAEGVETQEQADELSRLGCDFGQGFLWSRPLSAEDFALWFEAAAGEPAQESAAPDTWPGEPVTELRGYRSRHEAPTGPAPGEALEDGGRSS